MKTKTSAHNWRRFLNCCAGSAALVCFTVSSSAQTPVILTQPQDQAVVLGGSATFTVTVSNTGPFSYQWQFDGTNLPNDLIATVAGNGSTFFTGDGAPATNAGVNYPYGLALDASNNLFIADSGHNRIRMVSPNGIITTVAGNGEPGFGGDGGQAINASLNSPSGVLAASGILYIADYANNCIRKVDTNGVITTIAGNGIADFSGDGGPATNASLYSPTVIVLDNTGSLLITDFRNNRIRKVDTNGIITTVAGSGPNGVGVGSYSGDGGPATNATFYNPSCIALDAVGNLFISDTLNSCIRKVDTNGIVSTVAGNGTAGFGGDGGPATNASINNPYYISVDPSGNLFISDNGNNRMREVTTDGIITTLAGNGTAGFSGDGGPATAASFNDPGGSAVLNGQIYVSDYFNNRVRAVTVPSNPTLTVPNVTTANVGDYTVVVIGPSGSVTSSVAHLSLITPPCAASPSGLVGWWPAEGDARDIVSGDNGVLMNGASFSAGEVGSAFTLNGSGQYIAIPDSPTLRPASFTAEGWYNFGAWDGTRVLVAKPYGNGTFDSFALWISNGQLGAAVVTGNGVQQPYITYNWSPAFGVWHHVAYSYDVGSGLECIYVDGAAVASNIISGAISYDSRPFQIGADIENGAPSYFFDGEIDEVSLYSRALNNTEITAIYSAGIAGKCALASSILTQPQNQSVAVGGTATFSATVGGSSPLSYQWSFNGTNIDGATSSTLVLTNVDLSENGNYAFVLSNNIAGSVLSSNASLTVGYPPTISLSSGQSEEVSQGTNLTFVVSITNGTGPFNFQWSFDGSNLAQETNSTLNITNVQGTNAGTYVITVSSAFGIVSSNILLAVDLLPFISVQPQNEFAVAGSNVTLSVKTGALLPSVGSGALQLWLKADAGVITNAGGLVSQWLDQSGNTNNALQTATNNRPTLSYPSEIGQQPAIRFNGIQDGVHDAYLHGSGNVGISNAMTSFVVYDALNTSNSFGSVWVAGSPGVFGASRGFTIFHGDLDFTIWGIDFQKAVPVPTNMFRICSDRLNTNLSQVDIFDGSASDETNFSLPMSRAITPSAGYYVGGINPAFGNGGDSFNGQVAELLIYKGYLTDADRLSVVSYLQEKYFQGGNSIGDTFQWQFDGTNIAGATNATLTITNVQGTDAGTYTVVVTDPAGSVTSSNAVLTTLFPAAITTSPVSQSVSAGTTVMFTGAASGTAPLSYQWQYGGTNIAGATNTSFTVTNAVIANAGNYTLVALNPYGSSASTPATLSVDESTIQVVSASASAASTVVVSINFIALGTESGVGFTLNFDPAVLTYVSTAVGSGASGSAMQVNTNQVGSGHLGLGAAEFSGTFPAGTNDIFDITFRSSVVTNTTTTSLTFGNSAANEYISDSTAKSLPGIYLPGVVVISSTALEGDVSARPNGDEVMNIGDWIQEGRFVAGLDTITNASEFERADCAPRSTLGDGEITVADWVQVGRYVVGLDQLTAVGGPTTPTPDSRQSGHPGKTSDIPVLTLVPLTQAAHMNSVSVQLASHGEVNSAGFSVTYNPSMVQFVNATLGSGATSAVFIQNTNPANPGRVGFVVGSLAPATFPAGIAPLVMLNFAPVAFSNTTALAFADLPVASQLSDANAQPLSAGFMNASLAVGGTSWPTLAITPSGNSISLSWPSSGTSFSLQAASSLGGAWTNVMVTPTTNDNTVTLTAPVSNDSVYYRLKY